MILEFYSNPNQMWLVWKDRFTEIIDRHAPIITRKIGKKRTPWITKEILLKKRQKNPLKKKACKSKSESDWQVFKSPRSLSLAANAFWHITCTRGVSTSCE